MAQVTFKSHPTRTAGDLPERGAAAPNFSLVTQDLSEVSLATFGQQMKLLNIFPSMDTQVCSLSVKKFYEKCRTFHHLAVLNISLDLPFAASRFCKENHIEQAVTLSAFRSDFPVNYGVKITEGPLKGLCARAVVLLDADNRVIYSELVPEITHEPDYEAVLNCLSHHLSIAPGNPGKNNRS